MSDQIQFLENSRNNLELNNNDFAKLLKIHPRTLRDWSKGIRSMSCQSAKLLSSKTNIPIPADAKIILWNEHLKNISVLGGEASYKKTGGFGGNEEKRQKGWEKWWETKGKFQSRDILLPKKISFPKKSVKLAEFVGIMMGDGGVSKYHISITLNSKTDKKYSIFVCSLIKSLFGVKPKTHKRKDSLALDIVVNRIKITVFCKNIGLKIGNKLKQDLDIPEWVNKNTQYQIACIRGLFDTDGTFFKHKYTVKGKKYSYGKIGFSSRSPKLIASVHRILNNLCINAKINYNNTEVKIESIEGVQKYINTIGTSNHKHSTKNIEK